MAPTSDSGEPIATLTNLFIEFAIETNIRKGGCGGSLTFVVGKLLT
jgi:hypothetical protein